MTHSTLTSINDDTAARLLRPWSALIVAGLLAFAMLFGACGDDGGSGSGGDAKADDGAGAGGSDDSGGGSDDSGGGIPDELEPGTAIVTGGGVTFKYDITLDEGDETCSIDGDTFDIAFNFDDGSSEDAFSLVQLGDSVIINASDPDDPQNGIGLTSSSATAHVEGDTVRAEGKSLVGPDGSIDGVEMQAAVRCPK